MISNESRRLAVETVDGVAIVEFLDDPIGQVIRGWDDVLTIRGQLDRFVEANRPGRLLLDFSRVEFASDAMLAYLLGLKRRIEKAGGRLAFCSLDEQVDQIVRISKLDRVFEIHPDRPSALDAFTKTR